MSNDARKLNDKQHMCSFCDKSNNGLISRSVTPGKAIISPFSAGGFRNETKGSHALSQW